MSTLDKNTMFDSLCKQIVQDLSPDRSVSEFDGSALESELNELNLKIVGLENIYSKLELEGMSRAAAVALESIDASIIDYQNTNKFSVVPSAHTPTVAMEAINVKLLAMAAAAIAIILAFLIKIWKWLFGAGDSSSGGGSYSISGADGTVQNAREIVDDHNKQNRKHVKRAYGIGPGFDESSYDAMAERFHIDSEMAQVAIEAARFSNDTPDIGLTNLSKVIMWAIAHTSPSGDMKNKANLFATILSFAEDMTHWVTVSDLTVAYIASIITTKDVKDLVPAIAFIRHKEVDACPMFDADSDRHMNVIFNCLVDLMKSTAIEMRIMWLFLTHIDRLPNDSDEYKLTDAEASRSIRDQQLYPGGDIYSFKVALSNLGVKHQVKFHSDVSKSLEHFFHKCRANDSLFRIYMSRQINSDLVFADHYTFNFKVANMMEQMGLLDKIRMSLVDSEALLSIYHKFEPGYKIAAHMGAPIPGTGVTGGVLGLKELCAYYDDESESITKKYKPLDNNAAANKVLESIEEVNDYNTKLNELLKRGDPLVIKFYHNYGPGARNREAVTPESEIKDLLKMVRGISSALQVIKKHQNLYFEAQQRFMKSVARGTKVIEKANKEFKDYLKD